MIRLAVVSYATVVDTLEVSAMVAAWQTQIARDVYPAWNAYAYLYHLNPADIEPDMWVCGIFDDADQANALGYHDVTPAGLPLGKVFARTSQQAGVKVSAVGSHELLEMLGDPDVNLLVQDPVHPTRFFANELCDAVEDDADGYEIAGVLVSDFVLPKYFEPGATGGGPWDFSGKLTGPLPALTPGGYMAYVQNGQWGQIFGRTRARRFPGKVGGSGRWQKRQAKHRVRSTFKVAKP